MTADARDELHARATVQVPGDRLPEAGAGFLWGAVEGVEEEAPILRPDVPGVRAAFTTRRGGSSPPPADSLNLSFLNEPKDAGASERVLANRRVAGRAIDPAVNEAMDGGMDWSTVRQVHGARVVRAADPAPAPGGRPDPRPEADALWTDDPERTLAVFSADCVLLLLVGPGRIGLAHAGWRGLAAGVVERATEAVGARSAFAGPAIGPCCFEVGEEVREVFAERFGSHVLVGPDRVDLWAAAETAARRSGVEVVPTARICTSCQPELFFSHRRDRGETGRQGLVAALARGNRTEASDDAQR